MRMKHLWDREQRINKAWNYSWVQWRDVDWHGPRRGHTQTCSLTHTQTHTLLSLPWDVVNVCVNAIWTTTDSFKPLSGLLSPVAFPSPPETPDILLRACAQSAVHLTLTLHHTLSLSPKTPSFISPVAPEANNSVCWIMLCEEKQPSLCKPSCYRSCRRALRQSVGYGPTDLPVALRFALQFSVFNGFL